MADTTPSVPATPGVPAVPLTRAGLARRYGVTRGAITRALNAAGDRAPAPRNPGGQPELWDPAVFDAFWSARPGRGRPTVPTA